MTAGLAPATASVLLGAVSHAQTAAATLGSLSLAAPLAQLRRSHAAIQAFFEQSDPSTRMMEQYYLHDILTKFLVFRDFYPFGLVRTHFQHVNARQVRIHLPNNEQDSEALSTALYELLPGTWNYRWVRPRKSKCGPVNQLAGTGEHFANLSNDRGSEPCRVRAHWRNALRGRVAVRHADRASRNCRANPASGSPVD